MKINIVAIPRHEGGSYVVLSSGQYPLTDIFYRTRGWDEEL